MPVSLSLSLGSTQIANRDAEKLMNSDDPNEKAAGAALKASLSSEHKETWKQTLDEDSKNTKQRKASLLSARKATKTVGYNSSAVFGGGQTDENAPKGVVLG